MFIPTAVQYSIVWIYHNLFVHDSFGPFAFFFSNETDLLWCIWEWGGVFILLGVCRASGIYGLISFNSYGKFSVINSSNIIPGPFFTILISATQIIRMFLMLFSASGIILSPCASVLICSGLLITFLSNIYFRYYIFSSWISSLFFLWSIVFYCKSPFGFLTLWTHESWPH